MLTSADIVRDPNKIMRIGQKRKPACACGRLAWGGECAKCRRAKMRRMRKEQSKAEKGA